MFFLNTLLFKCFVVKMFRRKNVLAVMDVGFIFFAGAYKPIQTVMPIALIMKRKR